MTHNIFARVPGAYDLPLMDKSRVVVIGSGGSRDYIEQLARCGIREIAVVDLDTSSDTNIGTQQAYVTDIGKTKVACIRDRVLDINPKVQVTTHACRFEDLATRDLDYLLREPWSGRAAPEQVVLALKTDNFEAQAHGNRVGLHYGIPTVSAQIYQAGYGGEVTFTHPDTTAACNRCALESRFRAYLEQEYSNDVTSHGTPIWTTTIVNAVAGMVTLMLLHHGSEHPRWKGMLERVGNRNLVQVKLWPDFSLPAFSRVYANADPGAIFLNDTVWLEQKPDHPNSNGFPICPDCGGTGNLRNAIGSFAGDLHEMRRTYPNFD